MYIATVYIILEKFCWLILCSYLILKKSDSEKQRFNSDLPVNRHLVKSKPRCKFPFRSLTIEILNEIKSELS